VSCGNLWTVERGGGGRDRDQRGDEESSEIRQPDERLQSLQSRVPACLPVRRDLGAKEEEEEGKEMRAYRVCFWMTPRRAFSSG
jgi:hypothetical protein